jgi:hypothetical protein
MATRKIIARTSDASRVGLFKKENLPSKKRGEETRQAAERRAERKAARRAKKLKIAVKCARTTPFTGQNTFADTLTRPNVGPSPDYSLLENDPLVQRLTRTGRRWLSGTGTA